MSYSLFINSKNITNLNGKIDIQVEELSSHESFFYCSSNKTEFTKRKPEFSQYSNKLRKPIQNKFWIRAFTSGCYYYNENTGNWSSDGTEVLPDSNFTHIHCKTSHLTNFAGGVFMLPMIDFKYALAHASFEENKIVYILIIFLVVLYILLSITAYLIDKKDQNKINCIFLTDQKCVVNNIFFYELTLFTGTRKNSETDSQVRFFKFSM